MSDRGGIVLVVLALLVLVGAGAWFAGINLGEQAGEESPAGACGEETEELTLNDHLRQEAERLARAPDKIEQPDAKWIAQQLRNEPTAQRLRDLINQRFEEMWGEYAKRLKRDFPEFHDYPGYLRQSIKGDNGIDEIEAVAELAYELAHDDPRFEGLLTGNDFDPAGLDEQTKASLLKEAERIVEVLEQADEATAIVHLPERPETVLEFGTQFLSMTSVAQLVGARVRILAADGNLEQARRELTTLVSVTSRLRTEYSLIAHLFNLVAREVMLKETVLKLAVVKEVPVKDLKRWLELGRKNHPDVMIAFACEFADAIRVQEGGDDTFDNADGLEGVEEFITVEEFFREWRRDAEGRFAVMEYALNPHPPVHTPEGLADAVEFDRQVGPLLAFNVWDAVRGYWLWLALELRIFERENGPLHEHREEIEALITAHPWLKPRWDGEVLEVWTLNASGDEYIVDNPLFKLAPVQKD